MTLEIKAQIRLVKPISTNQEKIRPKSYFFDGGNSIGTSAMAEGMKGGKAITKMNIVVAHKKKVGRKPSSTANDL